MQPPCLLAAHLHAALARLEQRDALLRRLCCLPGVTQVTRQRLPLLPLRPQLHGQPPLLLQLQKSWQDEALCRVGDVQHGACGERPSNLCS